ncbi:hypothetical protein ONZ45_g14313 [Pleurotus djamor]|nr:hypothetical protein ONZ45_g14313 [Pleurotus djamor]
MQTYTPSEIIATTQKDALLERFRGASIDAVRTPALVIDRSVFARNCSKMHRRAQEWGAAFRAHLKTHKTAEGTRLQLQTDVDNTKAVVVSTVMEAWEVVRAGLVKEGIINDILYGLPVGTTKIADLAKLWDAIEPNGGIVRILIDHLDQLRALEAFEGKRNSGRRWSAFIKIDGGQKRAGVPPNSIQLKELIQAISISNAIDLYGFYAHAGNAYGSESLSGAESFLSSEVQVVNEAAAVGLQVQASLDGQRQWPRFVLSVGSTPTAHAASAESRATLDKLLHGDLELHAGNYPMLDLQQKHTTLIDTPNIAQRVLATVISYYPGRGADGRDEALVDGGAIAFSKDTGPSGGFGDVIGKKWRLERISQEHGTLVSLDAEADAIRIGDVVEIVGQHACLIAAAYPWYYIVDSENGDGRTVVDVWVPWKGW